MNFCDENVNGMVDCILADEKLCNDIRIDPIEQVNQNLEQPMTDTQITRKENRTEPGTNTTTATLKEVQNITNENDDSKLALSLKCDEEMPTFKDNPSLQEEVTKFYHNLQCTTNSMIKWINDIEETQPNQTNIRDITGKTEQITAKLITLAHEKHDLTAKIQEHMKLYKARSIHQPLNTAIMYDEIIKNMLTTFQLPSKENVTSH